jgi:plastocyanin
MVKHILVVAGLALATVNCGQSSTPTMPSPTTTGSSVSIVSGARTLTTTAYNPNPIAISAGGTVTWMNNDSITHTSTGNNGDWDSRAMAPGASFSKTFPSAGTFQYHCAIHPNMVGTVTVQ